MTRALLPAMLMSAAMLTGAQAQTIGTATTDLNLRSGPDPQFPVIGMLRERQRATVIGCIEGSRWCQVDVRGRRSWAYSQYMTFAGDTVALLPQPEIEVAPARTVVAAAPAPLPVAPVAVPIPIPVPVATPVPVYTPAPAVTYQQPAPAVTYPAPAVAYRAPTTTLVETTGVRTRAYAGRLIAPREVVYAATTPPPAYLPPRSVRTFIAANPLDPVYLEGSLTIGAGLPVEIDLTPVPGSRFNYAYVNDYPVLVDPASRRIVYVYR
ncbi:MAG: DUF1236 domain-containing protein [Pseudorhodoplanes sp.]|uniref:DUF1236 domain-containing protein n=1 Tax=Pseudorhodoplanes sp. TaxID=1934341 RepID=UPI003D0FB7C5